MAGSGDKPSAQKPTRSVEEIEADLARDRVELAQTLDALKVELDPRTQAVHLAEGAKAKVAAVTEDAKDKADAVGAQAKAFADDVAQGKPRALAIAGAALAAAVGLAVVVARRGR